MRTKKKLSLTIDETLYDTVEAASKRLKLPKSHLAQEALRLWVKRETEILMAKGYEEMAEEDKDFGDMAFEAQREILS
ncbi:MAG: hypothetical protein U5R49_24505 [Deltaproteobacteria bacterium]|nr:hypothetical protein [Deltaproteobacteria bacterium]